MELSTLDLVTFGAFFAVVISISLYKARDEKNSEDYFLAGRGLGFWLIGFSLIASNISTEHFVGMAGAGFGEMGLAVASYEWIAAITLVFVALVLLPRFLKCGIYTIPEFLEYRYNASARAVMAVLMLVMYVAVGIAAILYSGAIGLTTIFGMDLTLAVWLIGLIAGAYTIYGGLKAVVWTDLFQGAALLIGGAVVAILALNKVGGLQAFLETNADKLHLVLPADDLALPWTALFLGIWIPNLFYWGLNQFISQRTLAAKSVREGQKGVMLAATLKLGIPFIIVFPGIMAYQLYGSEIANGDQAYPTLIKHILPAGLRGIMFAALFGAVLSSLDSMLNSASTIFTMDLYKRHLRPKTSTRGLVRVGRIATGVFVLLACLVAPHIGGVKGIFDYIQKFQGFISPGIVAVFLFGLVARRAPPVAALVGMGLNVVVYGLLLVSLPEMAFLNHMAITFVAILGVMAVITAIAPLAEPVTLPVVEGVDTTPSAAARFWGLGIVVVTVVLYVVFW